jgi:transposase-like protein
VRAAALDAYVRGRRIVDIAAEHRVQPKTLIRWATLAGVRRRPDVRDPVKLDAATKRRLVSRYTGSLQSVKQIAELFGVTERTVYRIAKACGARRAGLR